MAKGAKAKCSQRSGPRTLALNQETTLFESIHHQLHSTLHPIHLFLFFLSPVACESCQLAGLISELTAADTNREDEGDENDEDDEDEDDDGTVLRLDKESSEGEGEEDEEEEGAQEEEESIPRGSPE